MLTYALVRNKYTTRSSLKIYNFGIVGMDVPSSRNKHRECGQYEN